MDESDYLVSYFQLFGGTGIGLPSLFHLLSKNLLLQNKNASKFFHPPDQKWMITTMFTIQAETSAPGELLL